MHYPNDLSDWSQALETLADEYAQIQSDLSRCRCSKCDRFGVVSSWHNYYGAIYRCSCLPISWVVSPETGEKIEEVES